MRCVTILHCKVRALSGTVSVSLSIVTYLLNPVVLLIVCYHLFDMISVFKLESLVLLVFGFCRVFCSEFFCVLILVMGFQAFLVSILYDVSIRAGMGTWMLPRSTGACL